MGPSALKAAAETQSPSEQFGVSGSLRVHIPMRIPFKGCFKASFKGSFYGYLDSIYFGFTVPLRQHLQAHGFCGIAVVEAFKRDIQDEFGILW